MLFIRTNTAGSGTLNGVKYLTIQKGEGGTAGAGETRIALLNLGQNESNNAGDLGDFYQWGRKKDGHEHIVWSKNAPTSYPTFTSGVGGTSSTVAHDFTAHSTDHYDSNMQIKMDSTNY